MLMRTKLLIAGAALAAALWWKSRPAAASPGAAADSSPMTVTFTRYLKIGGDCYREDFWDNNTTTRTKVDPEACTNTVGVINEDN